MPVRPTWGLTATILAPTQDTLRFVAHHLEAGAHRIYIFLDAPNVTAHDALKAHPKVRVTTCDDAYWQKQNGKRPAKHQIRQTVNATQTYRRKAEVDWLIHIDVDEFLIAEQDIAQILQQQPPDLISARVRPMEVLAGDGNAFKAFIPPGPNRENLVRQLYPAYGDYVKGGFISHVAGKPFIRSGLPDVQVRIHNAFQNGEMIMGSEETAGIDLAHCHAKNWDDWLAHYRYRLEKGSYRAELAPAISREKGGLSLHELFQVIEAENGESGLRAFYDEVIADTPQLREKLAENGLLRQVNLSLDATVAKHFPDFTGS